SAPGPIPRTGLAGARQRRREPGGREHADRGVGGDVEVTGAVDRHASRSSEARRYTVGFAGSPRGTGQRGHDAGRGDLADGGVVLIRNLDSLVAVDRNAPRAVEARGGAGAIVASPHASDAGQGRHGSVCGYLANGCIVLLGDVEVAAAAGRHAVWAAEPR